MLKRYIVEIGMGADLHGGNITRAAIKAVKDATSKSCLCGLEDILNINPLNMFVHVKIGCTAPDKIDKNEVLKAIPAGKGEIEVVNGGLGVQGLEVPAFGDGNTIQVAIAALTVYVDVD